MPYKFETRPPTNRRPVSKPIGDFFATSAIFLNSDRGEVAERFRECVADTFTVHMIFGITLNNYNYKID